MAKRDDEELRTRIQKLEFKEALRLAIWVRCCAAWSTVIVAFSCLGGWMAQHNVPVKAAWEAFWIAWGAK